MWIQILTGVGVSALTVVLSASLISVAISFMNYASQHFAAEIRGHRKAFALGFLTIWLTMIILLCVAVWALTFLVLGLFSTVEAATYFAIVSFTTLGFGDVLLPHEWRLLSGICAANGLLLFALCAAFLVEFFRRILELNGRV